MPSKVLSREACLKIKEMYAKEDERGRRMYSLMFLSKEFGVSETTVLRVIKGYGAFMDVPEPRPEMSQQELAAHAARVLALAQQPTKPPEFKEGWTKELEERYKKMTGKV